MSLSRFFNLRFLVVTSIVCCGTSCSDDDPKSETTPDAGDDSSSTSAGSSSSSGSSSSGASGTSTSSSGASTSGATGSGGETSADQDAGDGGVTDSPDDGGDVFEVDGSTDGGADDRIPHDVILAGAFAPLVTPEAGTNPAGRVQLQKYSSGHTVVSLQAVGLAPNTTYGAHLHAFPCEYDNGGGHYKVDPTITETDEDNEVWPGFTTNETGVGYGRITVDHRVRGDALSVVIHGPDSTKFMCADLLPESSAALEAEGSFEPFAAQEEVDEDIAGGATLVHDGESTVVTMSVTGLDPSAEYMAHLHALPCEVNAAGGHYKIDPTVTDALEENEVWPMLELADSGAAMGVVEVDHVTRLDAQSVVIHRQSGDTALKVACANLEYSGFESSVTEGDLAALETEEDAGVPDIAGEATMTRSLDGTTTVELTLEGLVPETDYGVHVHDMPCWLNSGGGHYKYDESITAAEEGNEIWLNVTSNEDGEAEQTVTSLFLARPEAQAVVVHAPGGARVGCIDLEL